MSEHRKPKHKHRQQPTHAKQPGTSYQGYVDHVSPNFAYLIVKELDEDPMIPTTNLKGARHGDLVEAIIRPAKRRQTGHVTRIIERGHTQVVGTIIEEKGQFYIQPDLRRFHHPVRITSNVKAEQVGHKGFLKIESWDQLGQTAEGVLFKDLGEAGKHEAETQSIILQYGLDEPFSPEVQTYVNQLPATLSDAELARRRDFRGTMTLTIDPKDAKDFDDALSFKKLDNGRYEVGIHIADVTHYVKEGTPLDAEARERGTSVYLVGQVMPMLPERLANNLCSLRPHEDRPSFSLVVEVDETGKVYKQWIGETVIHSDHRYTYEEVLDIINEPKGPHAEELTILNNIAQNLRKNRIKQGAITFDSSDVAIQLDEYGEPIAMQAKKGDVAHELIEEFALLTNRVIATWATKPRQDPEQPNEQKASPTFIYRVHEPPTDEKLDNLTLLLKTLGVGHKIEHKPTKVAHSLNKLLRDTKESSLAHIIQVHTIRSMSQARYTTRAAGHFGLGFDLYTHFTSPIRRYPDLLVHRLVKRYLANNAIPEQSAYEAMSLHSSRRERLAIEAERASIDYKQAVFMKQKEGEVFEGVITNIMEWGVFVEILNHKCEGMVRLTNMKDDYYVYDAKKGTLRGKRKGHTYKPGGVHRIRVHRSHVDKRKIDLLFV